MQVLRRRLASTGGGLRPAACSVSRPPGQRRGPGRAGHVNGRWPAAGSQLEDQIFACAAVMFVEPARCDSARGALIRTLGQRDYEFLSGCLAFIRTAHYWTMLHPEIESEEDMAALMRGHEERKRYQ